MNHIQPIVWRKGLVLSATFLFGIFLIASCKKKINEIGQNQIDQNELLISGAIDTFSIQTFAYQEDSIISENPTFAILGSYVDPVFGNFNAEIYTQIRLEEEAPDFGYLGDINVDSFVLSLEYIGFYGKPGPQNFEVFEITEDLVEDSTYYSKSILTSNTAFNMVRPGFETVEVDKDALTVVGDDTLARSQLRIQLSTSKAKSMLIEAMSGSGNFLTNDAFISYFKGLHIKTNNAGQLTGEGGIGYFNLNDPDSKLTLYYTDKGKEKTFDFRINSACEDFTHVDIDNSGTNVATVLADTVSGMVQYYAQSYGPRAVAKIPGLSNIPKNSVIHEAVLEIPVAYHTSSYYTPSLDIVAAVPLEDGDSQIFQVSGSIFDSYRKSYQLDLRDYIQGIVDGDLNNTQLVFLPALGNSSAERIIFNGPQTTNKMQPKLYIVYTEF